MGSRKGANLKKTVNGTVISPKPESNAKKIKLSERTGAPHVKTEARSGSICATAETFPMILSKEQLKTQEVCPAKQQKIAIKEPKLELEQTLKHCAKLKLQLFPIDERTRKRLEKDNHNPHLELALSARKRITSVLRHLNIKWGNSNAASGELMLFPYNIDLNNLAGCMMWTSKHVETSIGDVYGIIGRPAIFRLRYGWISSPHERFLEEPLASFSVKDPLQLEDLGKEYKNVNITVGGRQPSREPLPVPANDLSDSKEDRKETIDGEDNQSDAATMSIRAWADCISNMSMGSLFSDASRLGLMASKGDSHLRQASVNSDSFDAAIAAHLGRHQSSMPTTQVLQTSILDAEETCQGFLFQKPESFRDAIPFSSKCYSEKVKPELLHKEHPACPVEPGGNSQTNRACQDDDDMNELGITDVSWSCSLGPCDLGHLSSSRQIIGGDSISLGGLFATSLDAVQKFPLRSKDEVAPTV
ncbi:hypothetical protein H6P81_001339 [Aristolochia fimbriata]|uniref:TSL-kinase interacting protein 1 n=1 Tax=Aristolochia fimbriata TaxID=158543 RepID=A0AAV7F7U7_ARIFI|nr:hypothetical protein H6P81_001339 [Aristolochia fimbriata]